GGAPIAGPSENAPAVGASIGEGFGRGGAGRGGFPAPRFGNESSGPRPNYIPGLTGGTLASVSDAQAHSALIELPIYGIGTLYEKTEAKKDPNAPGEATPRPKSAAPKPDAPKPETPMTPAPTTPMPATPPTTRPPSE